MKILVVSEMKHLGDPTWQCSFYSKERQYEYSMQVLTQ